MLTRYDTEITDNIDISNISRNLRYIDPALFPVPVAIFCLFLLHHNSNLK